MVRLASLVQSRTAKQMSTWADDVPGPCRKRQLRPISSSRA